MSATQAIARTTRHVVKDLLARDTPEGVGVTVKRSIGSMQLRNLDPFLLLDHFSVAGGYFDSHPHRGFQTVTYMLDGKTEHEDFRGHRGVIKVGDIQWMKAGRGILHSEVPIPSDDGKTPAGLQLWINLKSDNKLDPPDYQEFASEEMPYANPSENVNIKVISGEMQGSASEGLVKSLVRATSGAWYFDIKLKKVGTRHFAPLPAKWTAFVYVLDGSINVGGSEVVDQFHLAVLTADDAQDGVSLEALSDNTRFILVAGEPLNEPIVQMGPFVMNTREEIQQAIRDFQLGQNGFEGAADFNPESAKAMRKGRM